MRVDPLRLMGASWSVGALRVLRAAWLLCVCVLAACDDKTAPAPAVPLEGVAITRKVGDLQVGETTRIQFTLYDWPEQRGFYREVPFVAGVHRVEYRVSDTTIATVSTDGVVTARRVGSTAVTVTVDGTFSTGDQLNVVRGPQELVVLASGDGDVDVSTVATCLDRPYVIPGPGR